MLVKTKSFFKKTRIEIKPDHDEVIFAVGNWELRLPYDVALTVAQQLRVAGKSAKRKAGDTSRILRIQGELTNANPYPKRGRSQIAVT